MNLQLLERLRVWEDPSAGIREEFMQPSLGGAATMAVLVRPLGPEREIGWVVCHSFGPEQPHLTRLEVMAARHLASAGFPVLRYHGQGYGDSELGVERISVASHLADAADAVALLRSAAGVTAVGTMGARFGGAVAALTAERMDLPLTVLWQPVVSGERYLRSLVRTAIYANMARSRDGSGTPPATGEDPLRPLDVDGWVDLMGFRLTRRAAEEVRALRLTDELRRFRRDALVVSLSRSGQMDPDLAALIARLRELGARCDVAGIADERAPLFGRRARAGTESAFGLFETIVRQTVSWALGRARVPVQDASAET